MVGAGPEKSGVRSSGLKFRSAGEWSKPGRALILDPSIRHAACVHMLIRLGRQYQGFLIPSLQAVGN